MNIVFFLKSGSVDLSKYTIKDIPGSSGRFDVIGRCILAALKKNDILERNIQIWVFLDRYGTYIFDSAKLDYDQFPKNELKLVDYFYNYIMTNNSELIPSKSIKKSTLNIFEAIDSLKKNEYDIFVLNEMGTDFFTKVNEIRQKKNLGFIIGSQTGEIIDSSDFKSLNLTNISLGSKSYLASSVIRLIKLYLLTLT